MFCTNCGQEVDNNSDFCPNCGACLKEAPETTTNYVNQPQNNDVQQYNAVQQNQVPKAKTNKLALAGFIVSLASLLFFTGIASLVGMILSIVGLNQIKKTGEKGRGFALAGTIIGAVLICLSFLYILLFVALILPEIIGSSNVYGLIILAF